MSAPMKRHLTEIQVNMEGHILLFRDVPQSKLKPIISSLKDYREESVPWRDLAKERMKGAGGETAYMVKSAREAAGMTQVALARKLNMPQANLSQIETGKRPVGKALAKRLARVFKLDYRVFL